MKKLFMVTLVVAISLTLGFGIALAGNDAPSGPHYNLNIIGVENAKNPDMTNSNRHTIFVALGKTNAVKTKIYLTEGAFRVCDGNGFNPAYDCDGEIVGKSDGAVFRLPANGNWVYECSGDPEVCTWVATAQKYEVYARLLGNPGGAVTISTCVETGDIAPSGKPVQICSTDTVILTRNAGPSKFVDVSRKLTTIYADIDGDGTSERTALFAYDLDYFWEYDNNGCRLAQLRFYELP